MIGSQVRSQRKGQFSGRYDDQGDFVLDPEAIMERVAENLVRLRQVRNLTQRQLAEQSGNHRTQIASIETKTRMPMFDTWSASPQPWACRLPL